MPHVLIVDDYPGICPVLQQALESLSGFRVSSASTSREALPLLDRDRPDLVVLDALMPGISGIELAADAAQRGIPVILMTGEAQASEELTASGWRHLHKPFRVDALLAEVRATLAEAKQNLEMVGASLERLRSTRDAHHQGFNQLRESHLRSKAAHKRREREATMPEADVRDAARALIAVHGSAAATVAKRSAANVRRLRMDEKAAWWERVARAVTEIEAAIRAD